MKDYNPLVSVTVLTYNSSKYVIETLESIRRQTYKNIELIVSDDYSLDSTVEICKEWIEKYKERFVDVRIIIPERNTGISANVNRSIKASRGEWIKGIAGDDILMLDAIEKYVDYIRNHNEAQVVFAKMNAFYIKNGQMIEEPFGDVSKEAVLYFNNQTAREQYISLLKDQSKGGGAPTAFIRRELVETYPLNEKYKGLEDIPQWINYTKNGIHLDMMDEFTVRYRRGDSLTSSNNRFYSPVLWNTKHLFFWNELRDLLIEEELYDTYNRKKRELLKIELLDCLTHNKPTFVNKVISVILSKLIKRVNFTKWY